ncbi:copper amine oxidase [Clostridium aceticum]|uniref:Copper amine oxidase n=1 Tax=Clostridium aceticum TaxID=84022 RepID=A0A0G3WIG3_9CLOT|nr:cadherin-like beta sandwich domain-containing protein [Clostridium aceticum]AKL97294.1 copper amine oxidase [Clostridium aceticum]
MKAKRILALVLVMTLLLPASFTFASTGSPLTSLAIRDGSGTTYLNVTDANPGEYSVQVPYGTEKVHLDVTRRNIQDIVIIGKDFLEDGQAFELNVSPGADGNTFLLMVEDGESTEFYDIIIYVLDAPPLSELSEVEDLTALVGGVNVIEFHPDILTYEAIVDFKHETVTFGVTTTDLMNDIIFINDMTGQVAQQLSLIVGLNTFKIELFYNNESVSEHTVSIIRKPDISVLEDLINEMGELYNNTEAGEEVGQYPFDAKLRFDNAIGAAVLARDTATTQEQIYDAIDKLSDEYYIFIASRNLEVVDREDLLGAIYEAEDALAVAVEGNLQGQYPVGSKAILQAAINEAYLVYQDLYVIQSELDAAEVVLYGALNTFLNGVITGSQTPRILQYIYRPSNEVSVEVGKTIKLQFLAMYDTYEVVDVTNETLWSSRNAEIASVSAGEVTGLSIGQVLIDVDHNGFQVYFTVRVRAAQVEKVELLSKIQEAEGLVSFSVEGVLEGQYPYGSVAVLQAERNTALWVYHDAQATQVEVNEAKGRLEEAIEYFKSLRISSQLPELRNYNNLDSLYGSTAITPAFNPDVLEYNINVGNDIEDYTIQAATSNGATIRINGEVRNAAVVPLEVGENAISIVVTAENGGTKTYTVKVSRDGAGQQQPSLDDNTELPHISIENMLFMFNPDLTEYNLYVGNSIDSLNLLITRRASTTVILNGTAVEGPRNVPLSVGENIITIVVIAENGVDTRTYTITATRQAASVITPPVTNENNNGGSTGGSSGGSSGKSSGGGGGAASTPQQPAQNNQNNQSQQTPVQQQSVVQYESKITDGLSTVEVGKGTVVANSNEIKNIMESGKPVVLESAIATIDFGKTALNTPEVKSAAVGSTLELGAKLTETVITEKVISSARLNESGLYVLGGSVLDLVAELRHIDGTSTRIRSFAEPVKVILNLRELGLVGENMDNLTAVRFVPQGDGTYKAVKLGGEYDSKNETFEFYTDSFSLYSIVRADNLTQIKLAIGANDYLVNENSKVTDVPALIEDGRTLVPLRVVAEALGAKVEWESSTRTVTIKLDGKVLTLVVDQTIEGMDVPARILESRTMVPIRYVSEMLGAYVLWFGETQTIQIIK